MIWTLSIYFVLFTALYANSLSFRIIYCFICNILQAASPVRSGGESASPAHAHAAAEEEVAGAYTVSGSSHEPTVNGVYHQVALTVNGHAYYTKGTGTDARVLYWTAKYSEGRWTIGDKINDSVRVKEVDGATPVFGPPQGGGWRSWDNEKYVAEASLEVVPTTVPGNRS